MAYSKELWAETKKKCRLNAEEVQMTKEMGLNPKSLIKNIPNKNEPWKAPVKIWIRDMYEERFGRTSTVAEGKSKPGKRSWKSYHFTNERGMVIWGFLIN